MKRKRCSIAQHEQTTDDGSARKKEKSHTSRDIT